MVAIGGITPDNARLVAQAGADSIAVITALFAAPSVRAAAAACAAPYSINPNPSPDRHVQQRPALRTRLPQHSRRRQLARARLPLRGRHAALHQARARPYVWDAEDKQYIDYVGSWGPAILGHSHPEVVRAVQDAAVHGLSFGAPTEAEIELAETLIARLPSLEQVRLVSSGTEATMTAIRLARGATGRAKIVKFEGCYHGHSDSLLVKAGSGLLTFGNPSSAGVPPEFVAHTLTLEYNNLDAVREAFAQHGADIACIIVEPVAGNMNLIKPAAGFLEGLREVCTAHGALLIFDEVMTGFRVGPQGVQGLTGVKPDLTTLAKVIGGGMPVGAFGGNADIMKHIAPLGGVYQAGTLSGNPVAVAAGRPRYA